jgi:CP4-57 regulatory protein AlpA
MQVHPVRILRIAQVRERTGLATSSIYKLISEGGFSRASIAVAAVFMATFFFGNRSRRGHRRPRMHSAC